MVTGTRASGGREFFRRLSIYLVGVAIGLVLLGYFQMKKQQSAPPPGASSPQAPAEPKTP